jgi:hypothetical protein
LEVKKNLIGVVILHIRKLDGSEKKIKKLKRKRKKKWKEKIIKYSLRSFL